MRISLIVAMSENGVIGASGDLPWRLSADLRRFKRLTMGHHIVMGRKTWESIGRVLPGRKMIVITRQADYAPEDICVKHSLPDALKQARDAGDDEVFIIGGGEIYRQALELVDRIYLTRVHAQIVGDTLFPDVDFTRWRVVEQQRHAADESNQHDHSFQILSRESSPLNAER